jgi:ankyrin repeat protein
MIKLKSTVGGLMAALLLLNSAYSVAAPPSIIEAIKGGNLTQARSLIDNKVDVNEPQADGATALHWAVHRNNLDAVRMLIAAGAEVDAVNDFGVNPLWLACENRNADAAKLLLEAGADPNSSMMTGESLLMTAAHYGNVEIVRALLKAGADVDATEPVRKQTPLMWAIDKNHTETALLLLEAGSDINAKTTFDFTPLMFAARNGETEVVKALLDRGADVNGTSKFMGTNLYLREGVTDNTRNDPGYSVLQISVHRGHADVVDLLLEHGADPDYDELGFTALLWACGSWESTLDGAFGIRPPKDSEWYHMGGLRDDKYRIIEALLKHDANADARMTKAPTRFGFAPRGRPTGATPYILAAIAADAEAMRLLVKYGADPTLVADNKVPAILFAAGLQRLLVNSRATEEASIEAVQAALDLGAKITDTDTGGNTVLHGAASMRLPNLVQYLADQGADLFARNKRNQSPEFTAARATGATGDNAALELIRELSRPPVLLNAIEEWGEMKPHIRAAVEELLSAELRRLSGGEKDTD